MTDVTAMADALMAAEPPVEHPEPAPESAPPLPATVAGDPVSAMLARVMEQQLELQRQQLAFQQQTLAQQQRVTRPENAQDPGISAFSYPEGEVARPKPRLRRDTYCNHVKQYEDLLTPAEIESFNSFTHNCTARSGMWVAKIEQNGTTERLFIDFPVKTPDDRMNLPNGLTLILAELRGGPRAVDVGSMAQRIAELEALVAAR